MPTALSREEQIAESRQQALAQRQHAAKRVYTALDEYSAKMFPENRATALEAIRTLSSHYGGLIPDGAVRMAAKYLGGSPEFADITKLKAAAQQVAVWAKAESTRGHDEILGEKPVVANTPKEPHDDDDDTDH